VRCLSYFRAGPAPSVHRRSHISDFDKHPRERPTGKIRTASRFSRWMRSRAASKPCDRDDHGFCFGGGLGARGWPAICAYCRRVRPVSPFRRRSLALATNIEGHKRLLETVGPRAVRVKLLFLGRRYWCRGGRHAWMVQRTCRMRIWKAFFSPTDGGNKFFLKPSRECGHFSMHNSKNDYREFVKASANRPCPMKAIDASVVASSSDLQEAAGLRGKTKARLRGS